MNDMTRVVAAPDENFKARFTTAEFLRMCDRGAFDDINIELIEGKLERMPPPGNKHGLVQMAVLNQLLALFGVERVRAEQGIDLGGDSFLGCDGTVLREPLRDAGLLEATDLLLVIEVAETTLRRDLGVKREKYAAAGVPNYWVIDAVHSVVHVHADPADGDYVTVNTVRFGEPLTVPGTDATITLA